MGRHAVVIAGNSAVDIVRAAWCGAGQDDAATMRRHRHRPDRATTGLQRLQWRARRRIPDPNGAVGRVRGDAAAVRRKGDLVDRAAMVLKDLEAWTPLLLDYRLYENPGW